MANITDPSEQGRRIAAAGLALQLDWARLLIEAGTDVLRGIEDHAPRAVRQHADAAEGITLALANIGADLPERASTARKSRATDMQERSATPEAREAIQKARVAQAHEAEAVPA